MKKLSSKTIEVIKRISEVGRAFNIEVFVLDKSGIRAKSDEAYIFLVQKENFDFLEFDSLCVSKISDFNSRLSFMNNMTNFSVSLSQTKELDSGDIIVSKLRFVGDNTAIELGCADASRYKLPWDIKDDKLVSFEIGPESMNVLNTFPRIVHSKNRQLNIEGIDGIIVARARDVEGDEVTHVLSKDPEYVSDPSNFKFCYSVNNVLSLIKTKRQEEITMTLTTRGVLESTVDGIKVMIFPEKLS